MRTRNLLALGAGVAAAAALGVLNVRRRSTPQRFDDRIVVITGGSRGLGLAIAEEFARRGARIALLSRDAEHLERARQVLSDGFDCVPEIYACDVRNAGEVTRTIAQIVRQHHRIDVLVNNAGTISVGPFETMTRSDYEDALATHFWGAFNTIEAAWKALCHAKGRIVNVTSIGGRISVPHLLPYSVSKFAAVGYSEGLRAEAGRFGVSVTTVTPGLMRTGSPRNAWFKGRNDAEYTWFMLSDTLPLMSVAASTAARRIVDACARRQATLDVGLPARIGNQMHAVAPNLFSFIMETAATLLPKAAENQKLSIKGTLSETGVTQSPLTALGRKAERDFNQR